MGALADRFRTTFLDTTLNLMPIFAVVGLFYLFVFKSVPEDLLSLLFGFLILNIGATFFLLGLEIGIFPLGNNLSNEFLQKGSIWWFAVFGFFLGFGASIAEPAIISIAQQASDATAGKLNAFVLRLLIAISVGSVVSFSILRLALGWSISTIVALSYFALLILLYVVPIEIVGLAFDSGSIATNVATVPLIVAIGLGMAAAIKERQVLRDGFGFVSLAVVAPIATILLYGFFSLDPSEVLQSATNVSEVVEENFSFLGLLKGISLTVFNLLPIIATILFFQYFIIKKPLSNLKGVMLGLIFLIIGLYSFVAGIRLGLFPVGEMVAKMLLEHGNTSYIYLFAFSIGFATTMAEPALLATIRQADSMSERRINVGVFRILVAIGIGFGILLGSFRLVNGYEIYAIITVLLLVLIFLALFASKDMVAFAFDLGGVSITVITLPLITAFGIFLATNIDGRDALKDGFGIIAFANMFVMIVILGYSVILERFFGAKKSR
ncbi:MAG: DUF1538 domain-containing protein [Sulfuricurvum sp.]